MNQDVKICEKCNAKNGLEAKYCATCGNNLVDTNNDNQNVNNSNDIQAEEEKER